MKKIKRLFVLLLVLFSFQITTYASPSTTVFNRMTTTITGSCGKPTNKKITIKGYLYRKEAEEIFALVNRERVTYGLAELIWKEENYSIATQRAFEISDYFAHERPDGSPVSTISVRLQGENLATDPLNTRTPEEVTSAWMSSSGHRSNILNPLYNAISISSVEIDGIRYWVQIFSIYE